MSRCLSRAVDRPRRARARRGGELLAARALGLAAAAHAELAEPAARPPLRRRRPGRVHDHAPRWSRSSSGFAARSRRRCAPTRPSPRCAAPTTATVVTTDQRRRSRARTVVLASGACNRADRAGARAPPCRPSVEQLHAVRLPQPRPARRRRRARRRRVGDRRPARRRAAAVRPAGHALRRRARADAAHLPGPRRAVVDGRVRASGTSATTRSTTSPAPGGCRRRSSSAPRSGRRSTSTRSTDARRRARRPLAGVRDGRRAVLRRPAQRLRAGRPQAESGCSTRFDEWAAADGVDAEVGAARAARADRVPARPGWQLDLAQRRDPHDRLGDRLPARLLAGSTCRCSTARASCATTAAWSTARASTRSACRSCGAASPRSSTASRTTRARSSTTSRYLDGPS